MEKNEILVIYGDNPQTMTESIAETACLKDIIGDKNKRIGIKPNLVVSASADNGATTHPEIVRGLIAYLRKNGFNNIAIMEGAWVGDNTDRAFKVCGYEKLAKESGAELINLQKDKARPHNCSGMEIEICESALKVDFMINIPVLKGHCQTLLTCALKNNKGVIPDREKRRFHSLGLHKPIAHLNTVAKNDFIIVDSICGDLDFEEGGNPVFAGRIFAARDPVLCDAWSATLLGYRIDEIPYIGLAEKLGIGSADLAKAVIREINRSSQGALFTRPQGKIRELSKFIKEDKACSACYASLIFALSKMRDSERHLLKDAVCIGQGFKGKNGKTGVGLCTSAFAVYCEGCPPNTNDILNFLRTLCAAH